VKPTAQKRIDAIVADRALAAVLEQIADFAGVPPNNRPTLIRSLQLVIAIAHNFAERVALFSGSDIKKSAKRIADAAAKLANAMSDEGAVEFIRLQIDNPRPQSLADYRAMTARFAEAAKRVAVMKDHKRDPWRLFREIFREWLLRDVAEAGGNLAHNQRHPERSKLIAALDLLAPFLPPEFSHERSFTTLRRVKSGVRKSGKCAPNS
jgi:hypothetical protein